MNDGPARLPMVAADTDDPRLTDLFKSAVAQQRRVSNLYRTLANSPDMLAAWTGMAWPLRHRPTVERHLRELGIMRVAQRHRAVYEWTHHWHLAEEFGVPEAQLRALKDWRGSNLFGDRERAVLAYADAIVDNDVPDAVFDPLTRWFDEAQLVELTLSLTFYCHVSRALVALRIEVEPGFDRHLDAL